MNARESSQNSQLEDPKKPGQQYNAMNGLWAHKTHIINKRPEDWSEETDVVYILHSFMTNFLMSCFLTRMQNKFGKKVDYNPNLLSRAAAIK